MEFLAYIAGMLLLVGGLAVATADPFGWRACHESAAVLRVGAPLECHHKARFVTEPLGAETLARCVCPAPASVTP